MELKHVIVTIIKILISTLLAAQLAAQARGAALMGGHLDNVNHSATGYGNKNAFYDEYNDEIVDNKNETTGSEEIPDPSALVLPGYNLPDSIFNHGKPFYVEKDPLTGKLDFDQKSPSLKTDDDEFYDYVDDEPSGDIYDKANIDRKDGSIVGHHKRNDVNQLTPNFHDFLNLPVKYNPQKYVYPLISSSYASTKIQGSVNKLHNHKDYHQEKTSTKKPSVAGPTFYTTSAYFNSRTTTTQKTPSSSVHATSTSTSTTEAPATKRYPEIYLTTTMANVLNSAMSHPSFNSEYEYYDSQDFTTTTTTTKKPIDLTTATTTTTRRTLSLFEQLFGDYDETVTTTQKTKLTSLTVKNDTTPSTTTEGKNATSSVDFNNYEYDDDYSNEKYDDNVAVENNLKVEPLNSETTTTTTMRSTTGASTVRVTSLPLGENHINTPPTVVVKPDPIIVATQNLREKLNSELEYPKPAPLAPSKSNIHIAPDQDTVSFVVGNQQSVEGGHYVGTSLKESPYDSNPFKPLYTDNIIEGESSSSTTPPIAVTIQPLKHSEASLAIGMPVDDVKPGQVVDEALHPVGADEGVRFTNNKVVFPQDPKPVASNFIPPPPREVLKLSSKPMYHQLPSDLTPPKESGGAGPPNNVVRPPARPPWDPRPGHFYSGTPEYARPPRPPRPEVAYKRIDNLPNILPQFRPNVKHYHRQPPPPYYFDKRLNRQPLLERPSNNRPLGYYPYPQQRINQPQRGADDRLYINDEPKPKIQDLNMYQTPPNIQLTNKRRRDDDAAETAVETLQMIQAKGGKDVADAVRVTPDADKSIYKVYPVDTPPIKLDAIDIDKKGGVVVGTRAEMPLPPSKIDNDFNYEALDRVNEAPVLKLHPKTPQSSSASIKSDFPYALERPSNNQWNTIDEDTEKPIAVAYTPTEPHLNLDKYSMPNYASPVIPEIRPGAPDYVPESYNRKTDVVLETGAATDFQAPFQASLKLDTAVNQGWHVVRGKNRTTGEDTETTTLPLATTSEFDIENFKPQLIGGFKPLYSDPERLEK